MPAPKFTARIVQATPGDRRTFTTVTTNTGLSQRETLEAIILNLAEHLGVDEIYKIMSARGAYFYAINTGRSPIYQSATNTILELSHMIKET